MRDFLTCFGLCAAGIILYVVITFLGSSLVYKISNHGDDPSSEDLFGGAWFIGSVIFTFLLIYIVVNYVRGPVAQ